MKLKLTKKEFKKYLHDAIKDIQSETFLEEIGQKIFSEEVVKYNPKTEVYIVEEEN